jgi:hypothetical protein
MVQAVKGLPRKLEAQSSNPNSVKKERRRKKKRAREPSVLQKPTILVFRG